MGWIQRKDCWWVDQRHIDEEQEGKGCVKESFGARKARIQERGTLGGECHGSKNSASCERIPFHQWQDTSRQSSLCESSSTASRQAGGGRSWRMSGYIFLSQCLLFRCGGGVTQWTNSQRI